MNDLKVSTAARAAGISESTVFLLEHGDVALLSAGEVARIAAELARQSAGQERGEAVAWVEFGGRGRLGEPLETKVHIGRDKPGTMPAAVPLYAAPTDAQSRIAELEAQAPIAYLPKWAFPRLERYGHTSAHMTKNVKDKADQYIPVYDRPSENVRRVAELEAGLAEAIASNSQYLRGINDLHQRLTESREQVERMREAVILAIADIDEKHYASAALKLRRSVEIAPTETPYTGRDQNLIDEMWAGPAAEKEQKI